MRETGFIAKPLFDFPLLRCGQNPVVSRSSVRVTILAYAYPRTLARMLQ